MLRGPRNVLLPPAARAALIAAGSLPAVPPVRYPDTTMTAGGQTGHGAQGDPGTAARGTSSVAGACPVGVAARETPCLPAGRHVEDTSAAGSSRAGKAPGPEHGSVGERQGRQPDAAATCVHLPSGRDPHHPINPWVAEEQAAVEKFVRDEYWRLALEARRHA